MIALPPAQSSLAILALIVIQMMESFVILTMDYLAMNQQDISAQRVMVLIYKMQEVAIQKINSLVIKIKAPFATLLVLMIRFGAILTIH